MDSGQRQGKYAANTLANTFLVSLATFAVISIKNLTQNMQTESVNPLSPCLMCYCLYVCVCVRERFALDRLAAAAAAAALDYPYICISMSAAAFP